MPYDSSAFGERPDDEFDEQNQTDIQELLDIGYEQLDGFRAWVDERLEMGARIAEQDCFNAEFLIDFLANMHHKGIDHINEFELRWFLFSHYIRKAQAEEETETRLPDSLHRFFGYLQTEHQELVPVWVEPVLDDSAFYLKRLREYHALPQEDERAWEIGFRAWCEELEDDLDSRCLWLPRDLDVGMRWGDVMGWREATLYEQATEMWQTERERLLRSGLDFESARAHLLDAYAAWASIPQEKLDDESPVEIIMNERMERQEHEEDPDNGEEDEY